MPKVYHWTTKGNAEKILNGGLLPYSFFAKDIDGWYGEICLSFDIDIDWNNREIDAEWQGITKEIIFPEKMKVEVDNNALQYRT